MPVENTTTGKIAVLTESQRRFFASGKTRDIAFRKEMLSRLEKGLKKWEKPLCDALWADLHKSEEEAFLTEIGLVYGEIGDALHNVARWARPHKAQTPLTVKPAKSRIVREPLGCSLIVAPWNYPVQLLLNPLVGAIAAGCTAILKPSPYVPTVSRTLGELISDTFPEEYIALVQGNREVNSALFSQRFDFVFLTGSPSLGRIALEAQARYLTPMVLELGGKSPCIVSKEADLPVAARRIAWGKCINSGQTCVAPDYLFLHEDIKDAFVAEFRKQLAGLYPDGTRDSEYFVRIVRDQAFDRVTGYLSCGKVLCGGGFDREKRWIEPTLLDGVSPDSPVMQEEIFGPIFPVMTYKDIREVEDFVNSREKPLAFYYFGDEKDGWKIISHTSSGGACINDTVMHIANPKIPFGGVGNSGMGGYHSERSFLAFSHERSVLCSPTRIDLKFRYMPYRKFETVRKLMLRSSK